MKRLALSAFDFALGIVYLHTSFAISTITYYWILSILFADASGAFSWPLPVWMMLTPILYITWLFWFLLLCCIELHVHRFWMRFRKVHRVNPRDGLHQYLLFYGAIFLYLRMRFVYSLPVVNALISLPIVRHLILRTYAVRTQLGHHSLVLGLLYDPDITDVGEGAVIGSGASVVGHSLTMNQDGSRVLVTVPISIGARSVIGGGASIHPGVIIGVDSIVEPFSYVPAMTRIGDCEVWGGNPARFLRTRNEEFTAAVCSNTVEPLLSTSNELALRTIVAATLHSPVEAIKSDFSKFDTAAWDSLAQLGISLCLQQRFGVQLSSQESFQLRSMSDLRAFLRRSGIN